MAFPRSEDVMSIMSESTQLNTPSASSALTARNADVRDDNTSSVPCGGSIFIIRSKSDGKVITLLGGKIILDKPGSLGTYRWKCVETKGWWGFQDPASAMYMGYGEKGVLHCSASRHQGWEYMIIRHISEGGYTILMPTNDREDLLPLGPHGYQGVQTVRLAKTMVDEHLGWEFIKVDTQG